jgi:hypothetical protein
MDRRLFLGYINEFKTMQMTGKGGNKLDGNYDIDIKKGQKGEVFRVFMGLTLDIFITMYAQIPS